MEKHKYRVPALERADAVLRLLASEPSKYRLVDLSSHLGIHKSSMFSLLHTMETLGWVTKEKGDTYTLGSALGILGANYFRQFDLVQSFREEAPHSVQQIGETIQLAKLEGNHVIYLGKEESTAPIRLVSDPGMRFPAHVTALGKVLLAQHDLESFLQLYPDAKLETLTPYTISDRQQLWNELQQIRGQGYACEAQEAVAGFACIAAPVFNHANQIMAAVSLTMMESSWLSKFEAARSEIRDLARRLSRRAGHINL